MQTSLGHLLCNVAATNLGFYRDLMGFLGWSVIYDAPYMLGVSSASGLSIWFQTDVKAVSNDYDGPGVNHIALHTSSIAEVDQTVAYLRQHGVAALFETPRHRPEFRSAGETYYQVMFESPDRLLFEVVYIGPFEATAD